MDSLHPLTKLLLEKRGITTDEEARIFLYPDYERDLHDPFLILNMDRAVERIIRGFKENERLAVWGDYDCDGIPGTTVLVSFLQKIGYTNFEVYIPHRTKEGYGLNNEGLKKLHESGVSLVVTVDSGITDIEPVAFGNSLGMEIIVTDHHLPGPKIPPAYAVINSKQEEDTYPFDMLAGCAVAFKLAQALLLRMREQEASLPVSLFVPPLGWEKWLLDLVGISTVADMVPLRGENRALAHFGLKVLQKTPRPGLLALFKKARLNPRFIAEDDIGFALGPRINAASRMDDPRRAFELLSTEDLAHAETLASHLESLNRTRKAAVLDIMESVDAQLFTKKDAPLLVVGDHEWRPGIVGLAASRIVDQHQKIAFVWGSYGAGEAKGSCRSDGTVNIVDLMREAKDVFIDFGGHEEAGGFSVEKDRIHELEEALTSALLKVARKEGRSPRTDVAVDFQLTLSGVSWDTFRAVEILAPFGMANPRPQFLFPRVEVCSVRRFGAKGEHCEISVTDGTSKPVVASQFFAPDYGVGVGDKIDLIGCLEKSMWGRGPSLKIRISKIDR